MFIKDVSRFFCAALMVLAVSRSASAVETMAEYADSPFFMSNSVLPNIMILADNSGSMNEFGYTATYASATSYSGYFSPTLHYTYDNTTDPANPKWVIDPAGVWLGSFLNWATMRKIDIARKVLVGGLAVSRPAVAGLQAIKAHQPAGGDYASTQTHITLTATLPALTTPLNPDAAYKYTYSILSDFVSGAAGPTCPTMKVVKQKITIGSGCKLNITGTGSGCKLNITATAGVVTAITGIGAAGTGYVVGNQLKISGGGGNAIVTVSSIGAGGSVTGVTITAGGTGYATGTLKLTTSSGNVTAAAVNTAGTNYTVGDILSVTGGNGDATVTVGTVNGTGGVTSISISAAGTGYYLTLTGTTTSVSATTVTYKYCVYVRKEVAQEPYDFVSNDVAGIVQKISTKARFGLTFFETNAAGGKVVEPIGQTAATGYSSTFISNYEINSNPKTATPLAETLWEIMGYFQQDATKRVGAAWYFVGNGTAGDPLFYSDANMKVPCGKNYVIIITDGEPTDDDFSDMAPAVIPAAGLRTLDAVALTAHTTDLRADIASKQVLTIYTVYTFGTTAAGRTLLNNTAKNGGFIDSNGSNTPDLLSEWHTTTKTLPDGTPQADNYFPADSAEEMESQIMAAFTDILKRASSGTAISVLATSASGAGNIFQAYFLPSKTIVDALGSRDITWIGHLLSLKIDSKGSLLDKNNNCISFTFDTVANETVINTLSGSVNNCGTTVTATTPLTNFVNYNWDAGELLTTKTAASRNIFTFVDVNKNGVVDAGEKLDFTTANAATLQKYLRTSSVAEATNVINWMRGNAVAGYRDRTINVGGDQYKLGDIIHSTPTVVGAPQESYGALYQDAGYQTWYNSQKNRTTMVYIGANDGMLHAFDATTGNEVWDYIPYNLLPHLKWLTDNSYPHVDYVDMKVKTSDINFGTSAAPNWKTVLIGGMRFGGGEITDTSYDVDGNGDAAANLRKWRSSFFAVDVTDPAVPVPLWEWNPGDNTLGFAMTYPAVVKVGDEFFAVVGTGPKAAYTPLYDGTSSQTATLFVINIKTGAKMASFPISDPNSFFSDPISVDIDFTNTNPVVGGSGGTGYNTDAVYVGETYKTAGGIWYSRMWRLITNPTAAGNDTNPANWKMYDFYDNPAGQYITSAPAASTDSSKNLWLFFGTGKYLNAADKTDTSQQAFYGIKDPCWVGSTAAWNPTCAKWGSLNTAGSYTPAITSATLVDTTNAVVATDSANTVTGVTGAATFNALKSLVATKDGWFMNFSLARERSLNKPTVIGGIVLFATFVPEADVCALGGNSWFYATYYETGSANSSQVIGVSGTTVLRKSLTSSVGMASSIAIHAGREAGAKAYVQMSTGQASVINVNTASDLKSGIIAWREL